MCNDVRRAHYSSLENTVVYSSPGSSDLLLGTVVTWVSPGLLGGRTNSDGVSLDSWAGVG